MKLTLRRFTVVAAGAGDARRSWPERHSLLLRLADADGHSGIGEASPLPGYSHETIEDVERALSSVAVSSLRDLLQAGWSWDTLTAVGQLAPRELPSARMALETAALDLMGQRLRAPATALLGAEHGATRSLAALIGPASSSTLLEEATVALDAGYRCLKVKLGAPGLLAAELGGIAALREHVGPQVSLRLDANGALCGDELARAITVLGPLAIELLEEPGGALQGALPLALDESLQCSSPAQVAAAIRQRGPRAIVLKPMALGGLSHCFELARLAQGLGTQVVISHCFDGPVAWRAAAALALALPPSLAHGLAPHAGLRGWRSPPLRIERGVLYDWAEPGLGAPAPQVSS